MKMRSTRELHTNGSVPLSTWANRRDIPLAIIGWLVLAGVILWLIAHISSTVLLFFIASFFAYSLVPVISFFERFMPRMLAILVVYLIVLTALGFLSFYIISSAIVQFSTLERTIIPLLTPQHNNQPVPLITMLHKIGITNQQLQEAGNQFSLQGERLTGSIVPFLGSIFSFFIDLILIAVLSIYLLIDGNKIVIWIEHNMPQSQKGRFKFMLSTTQRIIGGYIRGQIVLSTIIGILVGGGLFLFHVPYALLLGVLAFILEFIPLLGTFISGTLSILLALTQGWLIALGVLVYFIIIHVIEGDILGPRIVGKAIGLHPLVSIFCLLIGTELFGIVGALFAAPIAGVLQAALIATWIEWQTTHPEAFHKEY